MVGGRGIGRVTFVLTTFSSVLGGLACDGRLTIILFARTRALMLIPGRPSCLLGPVYDMGPPASVLGR